MVEFSDAYPSATFVKVDVDELPDVAQELGVSAMPTFLIFKEGEQIGKVVGANPRLWRALSRLLLSRENLGLLVVYPID